MSHPGDASDVLVVDDDDLLRERLVHALGDRGFDARGARTVEVALQEVVARPPSHAVVDLRMGERTGLDVVRAVVEARPDSRVVVLTGYGSIATALEAVRSGAIHYLTKPTDVDSIVAALEDNLDAPREPAPDTPSLARAEWEHINRVLVESSGNISETARRLGLHRRSLQRKLEKYPPRR